MDSLVIPRMKLARRSVGISSSPEPSSVVLDLDQSVFSDDTKNLQITASSRFNPNANLNGIDEIRVNITVEEGDSPVGERNPDQETHKKNPAKFECCQVFLNLRERIWKCN